MVKYKKGAKLKLYLEEMKEIEFEGMDMFHRFLHFLLI